MSVYIGIPEKIVKTTYKLRFRCAHENIQVKAGEVFCTDCDGKDITPEEATSILQSYLDAQEANEVDRAIQDE